MLLKRKFYNEYKPFSDLSKTVIINSFASILFTIFVLVFSLIRTSMIANIYGEASIGFLAIAIGILPYISSTHGGAISVSRYNLYNKIYNKQYDVANQTIADMKIQYYFFGSIYALITIVISFAFPFFFNSQGTVVIEGNSIPWYESSLFILSNCIETFCNYLIIPISLILFYIIKKSYISNFINLLVSFISNGVIISLLFFQLYGVINIDFIIMNIIITTILGLKTLFVVIILRPIRNKKITWYKRFKIKNKKISKDMVISICTQYFKQFNSDLYSVVFIIATNFLLINEDKVFLNDGIELMHEGHVHSGFSSSGIYYIFLFLITSSYEVVHTVVDNAIPSVAEHVVVNKKIHKTFFERYKSLVTFIATYTITTYIFTILFSSTTMMGLKHFDTEELVLMFLIALPFFIDICSVSYDHIIPVYGEFKKIMKYTLIKMIVNIVVVVVLFSSICLNVPNEYIELSIYICIIGGWLISSIVYLIINRRFVIQRLDEKNKFNILLEIKQYVYILFSIILMAIICALGQLYDFEYVIFNNIAKWSYFIIVVIGLANFFITSLVIKFFNKKEFNYYLKEFKCMISHYKHLNKNKCTNDDIIFDAIEQ